jgi:hypothetical protein
MVGKHKVESQQTFIMDKASYKCDQVQRLGHIEKPKTFVIERVKPCPKCKAKEVKVSAPCHDDKAIFPVCNQPLK